ncbi:hypothetical protein J5N97_000415 [Dioscorea zingiberensis]|uniref:Uncharacterized protein n=1 Tax=Dioscorea zingiberensis TaxID=325984 RepID=A0A9D5BUX7_9LILI|nr:hypothetical protein J5N97_000415 [Dioscorea zingiberensis]
MASVTGGAWLQLLAALKSGVANSSNERTVTETGWTAGGAPPRFDGVRDPHRQRQAAGNFRNASSFGSSDGGVLLWRHQAPMAATGGFKGGGASATADLASAAAKGAAWPVAWLELQAELGIRGALAGGDRLQGLQQGLGAEAGSMGAGGGRFRLAGRLSAGAQAWDRIHELSSLHERSSRQNSASNKNYITETSYIEFAGVKPYDGKAKRA